MPEAWRLVKAKHAGTAFSGDGAAKAGGRWNSRGVYLVYASASRSLAALETLVHITPLASFRYKFIRMEFGRTLAENLDAGRLPSDWRMEPPPLSTKQVGDAWVHSLRSAVLAVPSVIIPEEFNYLLNPAHPDFRKIEFGEPADFAFDHRLLGRTR